MEYGERHKKTFSRSQAKLKAEAFCAYQERAQQELRDKLYEWGLHADEVEEIISELIVDNFLNEERFAIAYVSGKFRMKGWGKIKIKQGLKHKNVSEKIIKTALSHITQEEYQEKLTETIKKKIKTDGEPKNIAQKSKLIRFLQSKGFESDLIFNKTTDILKKY
ncbi:regulatory protein RecX [Sphingobacterium psychroaquaticum]|uniref:Regulatory protein RecX n=1 Tax=Sphingobacterium psychroaquaticum TaxID=561061 RepID=A0A1X7IH67_9SPHI|nr:regulatory protein RecX [Sphingobacterium psychroaquaticum]SMG14171.1 regulatory protein [Sphingobacterium psychroaquaticum]